MQHCVPFTHPRPYTQCTSTQTAHAAVREQLNRRQADVARLGEQVGQAGRSGCWCNHVTAAVLDAVQSAVMCCYLIGMDPVSPAHFSRIASAPAFRASTAMTTCTRLVPRCIKALKQTTEATTTCQQLPLYVPNDLLTQVRRGLAAANEVAGEGSEAAEADLNNCVATKERVGGGSTVLSDGMLCRESVVSLRCSEVKLELPWTTKQRHLVGMMASFVFWLAQELRKVLRTHTTQARRTAVAGLRSIVKPFVSVPPPSRCRRRISAVTRRPGRKPSGRCVGAWGVGA